MPYRRAAGVSFEVTDGRAVLLDAAGSTMTTLNPTGTVLWRALERHLEPSELVGELAAVHTDVDPTRLTEDVERFLDALVDDGLVELVPPA